MAAGPFSWDERKRASNLRKHGVDFGAVEHFEFDSAVIAIDDRRDYGEVRYRAFGLIQARFHALVFTVRDHSIRVISLRRANSKEIARHVKAHQGR